MKNFSMLKRVFRYCFLLLSAVWMIVNIVALHASEFVINPTLPKPGAMLTVQYKPDSLYRAVFSTAKQLYVFSYHFNESSSYPTAFATPLVQQRDGSFGAQIQLRLEDVYVMFKVTNAAPLNPRDDRNKAQYWEAFVSRDGTTLVESSSLRAAMSWMGDLPEPCMRWVDYDKALKLLRSELAQYPTNRQAQIAELALAYELHELDERTHRERVQRLLSTPFDTTKEHYVRAMIRFLNTNNKTEESLALEERYTARYPKSELAQDKLFRFVRAAGSEEVFFERGKEYLRDFGASYTGYELQGHLMGYFYRNKKLAEGAAFLAAQPYPSPVGYNELAKYWYFSDSSQQSGLQYAQKAVELAYKPNIVHKPSYVTDIEWKNSTMAVVPITLNTLGAIQFQLGQDSLALATLSRSLAETGGKGGRDVYMLTISILRKQSRLREALDVARQGVINVPKDTGLVAQHKQLFEAVNPLSPLSAYEQEVRAMADSARAVRARALIASRLDMPMVNADFLKTDGKKGSLSDYKGKVIIVTFWASWCKPCLESMTHLNIFKKMNEKPVDVVAINVWESRDKDRLRDVRLFTRQNKYDYAVVVDEQDTSIRTFGISGLPTRLYIDKNGKVQFREYGFQDANAFYESAAAIVELLNSEEFYKVQP